MLQIRSRNLVAEIQQHLGNPAHADPTNAHEMNLLNLGKHKIKFLAADLHLPIHTTNHSLPLRIMPFQPPASRLPLLWEDRPAAGS